MEQYHSSSLEFELVLPFEHVDNELWVLTADEQVVHLDGNMVFAVKHDGRHKARLVAGGHLTDTPIDSVYSSVVSLRGIRILTFIAELNDMEIWATDIGNAYLESFTQEKVYIVAGPEFGDREGHTLIISRALYGLRSSGPKVSGFSPSFLNRICFFKLLFNCCQLASAF